MGVSFYCKKNNVSNPVTPFLPYSSQPAARPAWAGNKTSKACFGRWYSALTNLYQGIEWLSYLAQYIMTYSSSMLRMWKSPFTQLLMHNFASHWGPVQHDCSPREFIHLSHSMQFSVGPFGKRRCTLFWFPFLEFLQLMAGEKVIWQTSIFYQYNLLVHNLLITSFQSRVNLAIHATHKNALAKMVQKSCYSS